MKLGNLGVWAGTDALSAADAAAFAKRVEAWGDGKAIRARIDEQWQAGADHVCIQAIGRTALPDEHLLGLLARTATQSLG